MNDPIYIMEGELRRDWVEYESDTLSIGSQELGSFIQRVLGPPIKTVHTNEHEETEHFGKVRFTIQRLPT